MRYHVANTQILPVSKSGAHAPLAVFQEPQMAETEKEAYLALIAERDPEIRTLLDQGFEFVTMPSRRMRRRLA
jgi:hypothetical protein